MHLDIGIPSISISNHHLPSVIPRKPILIEKILYIVELLPQTSVMTFQDIYIIGRPKIGVKHDQHVIPSLFIECMAHPIPPMNLI